MRFTKKDYRDNSDDFRKMCKMLIRLNGSVEGASEWSLGRLFAWKYGLWTDAKRDIGRMERSVLLYFDHFDDLVGFAISENADNRYYILLRREYSFLGGEIVDSLAERHPVEGIAVYSGENDLVRIGQLEERGLMRTGTSEDTFTYALRDFQYPAVTVPESFRVATMREYNEYEKVMRFRFEAFNPGEALTNDLVFAFGYSYRNPLMDPSLDLVLLDEEGEPVSGCVGFADYENRRMEVEVVCTRADRQNRGYSKYMIGDLVKRACGRGIQDIHISGWNDKTKKIYSSFGVHSVSRTYKYAKQ